MFFNKKNILKSLAGIVLGAAGGYAYYYFIGCNAGGSCPITGSPYVSTMYGAFMGLILAFPSGKKKESGTNEQGNK